ncbi:hypothetical protein FRX31_003126 [Thalictrum thalictroides]|uniref:Uncharacterized protein n=1 Tax=Thalictrum thalictroides TaxID=46969 RepID=A0A7J6XBW8_THATH|nr:hypothetical protein FRX31_003126 [Thalictrum thalictroides]
MLQHVSSLVGGKVQSSLVVPSHSAEVGSNSQRQPPIAPLNLGEMFDSVTPNSRCVQVRRRVSDLGRISNPTIYLLVGDGNFLQARSHRS